MLKTVNFLRDGRFASFKNDTGKDPNGDYFESSAFSLAHGGAVPLFFQEVHFEPVDVDTLCRTACGGGPAKEHCQERIMIRRTDLYGPIKIRIVCRIIRFRVQIVRILSIVRRTGRII